MIIRRIKAFIIALIIISGIVSPPVKVSASALPAGGIVSVSSGRLNVRSSPTSSSAVAAKLQNGSYVTLLSSSGSWYYVEYGKNQYGYCHSAYISTAGGSQRMVYTSSGRLNVRSGPGSGYSITTKLNSGERVIVFSSSGYWSRILYHGSKTGYVYNPYLGPVKSSSGYNAVSLNVPSYKQYDSRWSAIKIGSYGETIGTIGCATTAIAMLESYRSGTAITPASMRYKLSYTASGSVYWPSDYKAVTSSSNYLSGIYSVLKSGKPVLLGLKNKYGGQHWVVVTGFKGGSLIAANFTINDPGSDTRVALSQVLTAYPNFYKYFYY